MSLTGGYKLKKIKEYFLADIPKDAQILEIGCANGWFGEILKGMGFTKYTGLDIVPNPHLQGDIKEWRKLGLQENQFDYIIALEVVEHVDMYKEVYDLLKPNGQFFVTTPVPHMDWACKLLEFLGVNQKRTSPHSHLIYFKDVPYFTLKDKKIVAAIGQWGKFKKV